MLLGRFMGLKNEALYGSGLEVRIEGSEFSFWQLFNSRDLQAATTHQISSRHGTRPQGTQNVHHHHHHHHTTDDDEDHSATDVDATEKKQRYKRRKIAIFFAYCGVGYQGMQKNPGAKTIEGDLEEALFFSGAVPEQDRGFPKRFDWAAPLEPTRAYVYLIPVFALDPSSHPDRESVLASLGSWNELVKCLECLERGRKVEGVMGKRSFEPKPDNSMVVDSDNKVELGISLEDNSKDTCFETTADTDILSNNGNALLYAEVKETNDETTVDTGNSSNSGNALSNPEGIEANVASLEKSDCDNSKQVHFDTKSDTGISSNNGNTLSQPEIKDAVVDSLEKSDHTNLNTNDLVSDGAAENEGAILTSELAIEEEKIEGEFVASGNGNQESVKGSGFCYGEEERDRFNRILKRYEGTHNFHNFTTRTKAEDPSANGVIISFDANTIVNVQEIEFVKCEVVGQSFMLHQIRKMVGVGVDVAIMRNCAPELLIETALQQDVNINVPTAPEVGLYLDECLFASYNQKWKDSHEEVSMKAYAEEAEEFKMKRIYSPMASTEHKEGAVAIWLHSLNHRNYPDLRGVSNGGTSDSKCAKEDAMHE
ncbi:pseudouridine synthase family protein [Actinidia rufa]|uniref:Pseudouridine synthase family protein n=1 Tax=Actinidia rufa TaxID=165716 RepID=A0A7J0FBL0_9ERIC|nr:pseudouridine synthase family protein [Actinidia rufa]